MSIRPDMSILDRPSPLITRPPVLSGGELVHASEALSPRESAMRTQMVCLMIANGEPISSVATKLKLSEKLVENIVMIPSSMEMIVRFQHDIAPEPRQRIGKMASIALDVQTRLLLGSAPDSVKAMVSENVLNRAMGKATQVIETRTLHFDLKDAAAIDNAMKASQEKLKRIEDLQKTLAISVSSRAA